MRIGILNDSFKETDDNVENEQVINYSTHDFLINMSNSYHNDVKNITKQFLLDFNRLNIYTNNKRCESINEFIDFIKNINYGYKINNTNYTPLMICMLLCCQSSYEPSFSYINTTLPENCVLIDDGGAHKKIFINILNNKYLTFDFNINYLIFDINLDKVIKLVKCNQILTIENIYNNIHYIVSDVK